MILTIDSKYRFTLPQVLLEHMMLKPGDKIKFVIRPNGGVVMSRKDPIPPREAGSRTFGNSTLAL